MYQLFKKNVATGLTAAMFIVIFFAFVNYCHAAEQLGVSQTSTITSGSYHPEQTFINDHWNITKISLNGDKATTSSVVIRVCAGPVNGGISANANGRCEGPDQTTIIEEIFEDYTFINGWNDFDLPTTYLNASSTYLWSLQPYPDPDYDIDVNFSSDNTNPYADGYALGGVGGSSPPWYTAIDWAFKLYYEDDLDFDFGNASLVWDFPKQDWIINNSEWNDWAVYYQTAELGRWNLLIIHYEDANNISYNDWEFVASTTNLTSWTINRTNDLPDGPVRSTAKLIKIDSCAQPWADDCTWTDMAWAEITWQASSTGYTVFDNPWELPGFTPASTTAESDEDAGIVGQVFARLKNLFPLSIAFQIKDAVNDINAAGGEEAAFNLTLTSILPELMAAELSSTTSLLSAEVLNTGIPFWEDTIYPWLQRLVYIFWAILIIFIMWPRLHKAAD